MKENTKLYFPAIDYLRLICAVAVVLFHLAYAAPKASLAALVVSPGLVVPYGDLFAYGWVGVQVFFVVSGFVIAESAESSSPWTFLRRRMERLYPAVWICAPLSAIIWIAAGRPTVTTLALLAKSMLLVPGGEWIDAPYWTLGCEIGFYAFVLLVLLAGGGRRRLEIFAFGLAVASILFWALFALERLSIVPTHVAFLAGVKPIPIYYGMYFALGMILYFHKRGDPIAHSSLLALGCVAAGVVETSLLLQQDRSAPTLIPTALWLAGTAVILFAPGSYKQATTFQRFARTCGLATYPLYLVHFASGVVVLEMLRRFGFGGLTSALTATAFTMGLAFAVATLLEGRVRAVLRTWLDRLQVVIEGRAPKRLFAPPSAES